MTTHPFETEPDENESIITATADAGAVTVCLFDLDGVIRHFSPERCREAADAHSVSAGDLVEAAFGPPGFHDVITGRVTKAEWIIQVGRAVGSAEAAADWLADIGTVDPAAVDVLRAVRAHGLTVALLTNGTNEVSTELETHGLDVHFDRVFNTSQIGVAKPDSGAFLHVTETLGVEPSQVFFTDDRLDNVEAAASLGFVAHLFTSAPALRKALEPHLN